MLSESRVDCSFCEPNCLSATFLFSSHWILLPVPLSSCVTCCIFLVIYKSKKCYWTFTSIQDRNIWLMTQKEINNEFLFILILKLQKDRITGIPHVTWKLGMGCVSKHLVEIGVWGWWVILVLWGTNHKNIQHSHRRGWWLGFRGYSFALNIEINASW